MDMHPTVKIVLLVALPLVELISIYIFYYFVKRFKLINKTKTSRIGFLGEGFHEIKGKIVSLSENLTSPLTQKSCVYYKFEVKERRGSGKNARWVTIIDDEKYNSFSIADSTGQAIIDLKNSKLEFHIDKKEDSGVFDKASSKMIQALAKYDKTNAGMLFEKSMRYKETYLEEGDALYVLGEVLEFKDYKPVFRTAETTLFISDKSEQELLSGLKAVLIIIAIILLLVPAAEIFLILY